MQSTRFITRLNTFLTHYGHTGDLNFQSGGLPFRIPYSLAERFPKIDNPVIRQFIPSKSETIAKPYETADPLAEKTYNKCPGLIHEYESRVLIRSTGQCAAFCRFCFRRNLQTETSGFLTEDAIGEISTYIREHKTIREILISGGDPLFGTDSWFLSLMQSLRAANSRPVIRICTRVPIVLPERITHKLLTALREYNPVVFVIHCNHPDELDCHSRQALAMIRKQGFYIFSQTVLLRTINDNVETLEKLFSELYRLGVIPYYLFQGDLAQGTSEFRAAVSKGLALYNDLRKHLSGLELPRYAVDAPQGLGKVYLPEDCCAQDKDHWLLQATDGRTTLYPEEL